MKRIFVQIFGLFILGITTSCSGFLDTYPNSAVVEKETYTSFDDIKHHWIGVYSSLKAASGFTEAGRVYGDIQCDLAYSVQGNSNTLVDIYNWNVNSMSSEVSGYYSAMWTTIGRINRIFDHLPQVIDHVSSSDSAQIEMICGDLYFIRALCYSELVKYFCEAYDPATADKQLGMPICETVVMEGMARASLKDTYDFIYKDLDRAQQRVTARMTPEAVMGMLNVFVSREAVRALRARMALYQKNYTLATEEAYNLIVYAKGVGLAMNDADAEDQSGTTATDVYAAMFTNDANLEVLFMIGFTSQDVQGSVGQYFCREKIPGKKDYLPEFVPSRKLLNMYDKTKDIRYPVFFSKAKTAYSHNLTWEIIIKDGGNYQLNLSQSSPKYQSMAKLFRLSEQYLILAEANAQPGTNLALGQEILNEFKGYRIKGYINRKYTREELLEEIKNERMREFCFEGFRLADLKRWKDGFRRQVQPFTNAPGNEKVIEADNVMFTWPIPKHELDVNSKMQKNASN